jgi:MtaA/CmuA family methyltransferase
MNGRERVLTMLDGGKPDHLPAMPITMQFAADLVGAKYLVYATDYRVQVAGQLAVAERFGVDYVSGISDPGVEAADLGAAVIFPDDSPPVLDETNSLLMEKSKLAALSIPDPGNGRMSNRIRAIQEMNERVGNSLVVEGWIEGPCAEAADLRGINRLMTDFFDDPDFVMELFEFILQMELRFAEAQIRAGADIIGIGDAAASLVGPKVYEEFVRPFQERMISGVKKMGSKTRLHICGNTRKILSGMGTVGADMVDIDYPSPMLEGRAAMGSDQVLLGNIDPVRTLRDGSPKSVYEAIRKCHQEAGGRYIVGAGCEVTRDTSHENFHAMVQYAIDTRL